MHFQIYFSSTAQEHFDIPSAELVKDSETKLSIDWWSMWRCDFLIETEDGSQQFFLFTNAATRFSLIIASLGKDLESFIQTFQQTLVVELCDYGMPFPKQSLSCEIELLRGNPRSLINDMHKQADQALDCLCEQGLGISATEKTLHASQLGALNSQPARSLVRDMLMTGTHPYGRNTVTSVAVNASQPSNILAFPGVSI